MSRPSSQRSSAPPELSAQGRAASAIPLDLVDDDPGSPQAITKEKSFVAMRQITWDPSLLPVDIRVNYQRKLFWILVIHLTLVLGIGLATRIAMWHYTSHELRSSADAGFVALGAAFFMWFTIILIPLAWLIGAIATPIAVALPTAAGGTKQS